MRSLRKGSTVARLSGRQFAAGRGIEMSRRGGAEMKVETNLPALANLCTRAAERARRWRSDEGGSLVEFAILLPVMFVLVAMAGSFTLAFYNLQQLGSAVATGDAIVASEQGVTSDPCYLAQTTVLSALPGWTASSLSFTLTVTNSSGTGTTETFTGTTSSPICEAEAAESDFAPNEPVTLTVTYSYSWLPIPNFHPFGALTPSTPLTTSETAMAD
jgi:Flp pilus assembly protein TadG